MTELKDTPEEKSKRKKYADLRKLAMGKYPEEFAQAWNLGREGFRDWLNSKTGLECCHIQDRDGALDQWIAELRK